MFYFYIILMSLLIIPLSFTIGKRIQFSKLSLFFLRKTHLKSFSILFTILIIVFLNLLLYILNEIIITGDGFSILSKSLNHNIILGCVIFVLIVPAFIGYIDMKNIVNKFQLNNIADIYIQTNRLAKALNRYITQHLKSIYKIDETMIEWFKSDDEIHDYLNAYQGLKDDLLEIKIKHIHYNDIHGAIKIIDQNIISINNQMGLINYFLGDYNESRRLFMESYEMYPRALIVDGMMLAFIVLGITAVSVKLNLKYDKYVDNTRVYLHQINKIEIYNWFVEKLKEINASIEIN